MIKIAKTTVTLFDILKSELINQGHSEFYHNNRIVFYDDEYAFIKKIMTFDTDVYKIVDKLLFLEIGLETKESDKKFKQTFVNRFLNKQINRQTVEDFTSQVVHTFLEHYDYLNNYYKNIDRMLSGEHIQKTNTNNHQVADNRMLQSTTPQTNINLNVDDSVLEYGDNNTINKNKQTSNNESNLESNNFNVDHLIKSKDLLNNIFIEFDKNCFLQVF